MLLSGPLILRMGETGRPFELMSYAPGTYTVAISPGGTSILASLLVETVSAGASVEVVFWQTTAGDESAERTPVGSFASVSVAALAARQTTLKNVQSKLFADLIVSIGSVRCGLIVTVVPSSQSSSSSSSSSNSYYPGGW